MEIVRHCASCLEDIVPPIHLCKTCYLRAYCSEKCEFADKSVKGNGQGHEHWCLLGCGEEDIDWKVCKVPGKGLGLIAIKPLPRMTRIIVERPQPSDHPGFDALMPIGGTYQQKYNLNKFVLDGHEDAVCIRISRTNHSCKPNAAYMYDKTFNVLILYALTHIMENEEITINYQPFDDVASTITPDVSRSVLENKWNITCPTDCPCYDEEMEKLMAQTRKMDRKLTQIPWEKALNLIEQIIHNYDKLNSPICNYSRTYSDGYQIAKMCNQKLIAKEFIENEYSIKSSILSPESTEVQEIEKNMKDIDV